VPLQGTRLRGFQNQADAIDAALELAAREGIGAVTFARVARDTGRSKSAVFEQFGSVERLRSRVLRRAAESTVGAILWPAQWTWGVDALLTLLSTMVRRSHESEVRLMAARPESAVAEVLIAALEHAAEAAAARGHLRDGTNPADLALELYAVGTGLCQARRELGENATDHGAAEIYDIYVQLRLSPLGRRRLARSFVPAEAELSDESEENREFIQRLFRRLRERLGPEP